MEDLEDHYYDILFIMEKIDTREHGRLKVCIRHLGIKLGTAGRCFQHTTLYLDLMITITYLDLIITSN